MRVVKKFLLVLIVGVASMITCQGQNTIKWMSWEEALTAHKEAPRKIVVDIYTDWCMWCKKMDKATFQKDHIAKYINANYYAVKFDAETRSDIAFNGKKYGYTPNGRKGYHELALAITQGKLSYPTVVFLDESLSVIQPIPGFQDAKTFEQIMTYFAEDHYRSTPWATYTRTYKRQKPARVHTVSNKK